MELLPLDAVSFVLDDIAYLRLARKGGVVYYVATYTGWDMERLQHSFADLDEAYKTGVKTCLT